jgi:hypothetical protein
MLNDGADTMHDAISECVPWVFVVGTGRSGTNTLADMLNDIPGCVVQHERRPVLFAEACEYLRGELSQHDVAQILRESRLPEQGATLMGEANQRLSFVLPALAEAFPESRYISLVRDGRDTVASMMHRLWYHDREAELRTVYNWPRSRITAEMVGEMSSAEWRRMGQFAKCSWYWSYTYRKIDEDAARLGLPLLVLKLEHLADSLPVLFQFLELKQCVAPRARRLNKATSPGLIPWRLWTRQERAVFAEYAGAKMDEYYPGWRLTFDRLEATEWIRVYSSRAIRDGYRGVARLTQPLRRRLSPSRKIIARRFSRLRR